MHFVRSSTLRIKPTTKPSLDELWAKRGNFVNATTGEVGEQPAGWFPIVCGPWVNPNVGCRQARCSKCDEFVGISPNGWAKHIEKPEERPLFCPACFEILRVLVEEMELKHPGT